MLPAPAHGHALHRMTGPEQGTVRVLLPSAAGYQLLHDDLFVTHYVRGPAKGGDELGAVVRAPRLHVRRVEEMLLDGGLHHERAGRVDGRQIGFRAREPGARYRDRQSLREPVGLAFVPDRPDGGQAGSRHPEVARQQVAVRGQGGDVLVPGRVQNPPGQPEPAVRTGQGVQQRRLTAQVTNAKRGPHEARRPGDRGLVADDPHLRPWTPEAAGDPQALAVPADDHPAHLIAPPGDTGPGGATARGERWTSLAAASSAGGALRWPR